MRALLACALLYAAPLCVLSQEVDSSKLFSYRAELLDLKPVREPSGLCLHSGRNTLFVVDDSGVVCEFTAEGEIVKQKLVRAADFEGIAHDPSSGLLYLAIEGDDSILEIDPETLEPKREFSIPRAIDGRTVMAAGSQGIEGIAFATDPSHPHGGTFFIANQSRNRKKRPDDISIILEVELPLKGETSAGARIVNFFEPDMLDVSGLHYDQMKDALYAISDTADRLAVYSRTGELRRAFRLPGENQEGIALNPAGFIFIAQDSGGVLKLMQLESSAAGEAD